jgi:hypothetical protein
MSCHHRRIYVSRPHESLCDFKASQSFRLRQSYLYGPARFPRQRGEIYKMSPDGGVVSLDSFDNAHSKFLAGALMQGRNGNFYGTAGSRGKDDDVLPATSTTSYFVLVVVESQSRCPRKSCALDARSVCFSPQVFFAFAGGASATAASPVSRRKVNVSCRYKRTAASVWLR